MYHCLINGDSVCAQLIIRVLGSNGSRIALVFTVPLRECQYCSSLPVDVKYSSIRQLNQVVIITDQLNVQANMLSLFSAYRYRTQMSQALPMIKMDSSPFDKISTTIVLLTVDIPTIILVQAFTQHYMAIIKHYNNQQCRCYIRICKEHQSQLN